MKTTFVHKISDLPNKECFAILTTERTTVPGDERSRTNPGHGYPQHTVDNWNIQVFDTESEWFAAIEQLEQSQFGRSDYKAVIIRPAAVTRKVVVSYEVE